MKLLHKLKEFLILLHIKRKFYNEKNVNTVAPNTIVFISRSGTFVQKPDLMDLLKAIISVYSIAEDNKYQFKIYIDYPFDFLRYLLPNKVNWYISKKEININKKSVILCKYDLQGIIPKLGQRDKQYHCYIYSGKNITR